MAGKRATAPASRPAPTSTGERGGTEAVRQAQRERRHQQYVKALSTEDKTKYEQGAQEAERQDRRDRASAAVGRVSRPFEGTAVDSGAGFILGLLFWGWIALPFLKGGTTGVRDTLRAKFFNKASDGSWLP